MCCVFCCSSLLVHEATIKKVKYDVQCRWRVCTKYYNQNQNYFISYFTFIHFNQLRITFKIINVLDSSIFLQKKIERQFLILWSALLGYGSLIVCVPGLLFSLLQMVISKFSEVSAFDRKVFWKKNNKNLSRIETLSIPPRYITIMHLLLT